MIQYATLDPATLMMWIDPSMIDRGPRGRIPRLAAAVSDDFALLKELMQELPNSETRFRCVQLVSSIWHEKRHFVDLILTNYGAFRFRQYLSFYANSRALLSEVDKSTKEIIFPLDIYMDEVRLAVQGWNANIPQTILTIAADISRREDMVATDREPVDFKSQRIEIGGDAQLEAIAFLMQQAAISEHIGESDGHRFTFHALSSSDLVQRYIWWLQFNLVSKIPRFFGYEKSDFQLLFREQSKNASADLIIPFLYAALAIRVWGQKTENLLKPSYASHRFLELTHFMKKEGGLEEGSVLKVWEQVNNFSKELWGRSVVEEIREDYRQEGEYYDRLIQFTAERVPNHALIPTINDYRKLREKLISILENDPGQILDPVKFSQDLLPQVHPIPISANPAGLVSKDDLSSDLSLLFGLKHAEPPRSFFQRIRRVLTPKSKVSKDCVWACVPSQTSWDKVGGTIRFPAVAPWAITANYAAPLAKLAMKGRNHRVSLGPELILVHQELKKQGFKVSIEGAFAFPDLYSLIMPAAPLYEICGEDEQQCDLCRHLNMVKKPHGYLLSPWLFRAYESLAKFAVERHGGGERGYNTFLKDWSIWFVCDSCCEDVCHRIEKRYSEP
jgi:hypothetical protein